MQYQSYTEYKINTPEDKVKKALIDTIKQKDPEFTAEPYVSIEELEEEAKEKVGVYWESEVLKNAYKNQKE